MGQVQLMHNCDLRQRCVWVVGLIYSSMVLWDYVCWCMGCLRCFCGCAFTTVAVARSQELDGWKRGLQCGLVKI